MLLKKHKKANYRFIVLNPCGKDSFRLKEVYILKKLLVLSAIFFCGVAASNYSFSAENEVRERYKQTSNIEHKNGDTTVIKSNEDGHRVVRFDSEGIIKSEWSGKSGGMTHEQVVKREKFPNQRKLPKDPKKPKKPQELKDCSLAEC